MSFFNQPNLRMWEKTSHKLYFDDFAIEVAPEDLTKLDGSRYFDYDQAHEAAAAVGKGWHVPTPAEMQLILAWSALKANVPMLDAEAAIKTFGLDFVGYGVGLGKDAHFIGQYTGEQGYYWLDSLVDRSRSTVGYIVSGYALQLMAITNSANFSSLDAEKGAAVRLIRTLTD